MKCINEITAEFHLTTVDNESQYKTIEKLCGWLGMSKGDVLWLMLFIHQSDSSSLTNEKDHHYFLNSADVCW